MLRAQAGFSTPLDYKDKGFPGQTTGWLLSLLQTLGQGATWVAESQLCNSRSTWVIVSRWKKSKTDTIWHTKATCENKSVAILGSEMWGSSHLFLFLSFYKFVLFRATADGEKKNTILSHCPTYSRIFYQLFLNIISTEYFLHTGGSISSKWFTETTAVQWMFSFVVCQVWWDALEGEGSPLTHFSIWECLFLFRLSNEVSIYTHEIKTLKKTLIQWVVLLVFFIIIIFCKKLYFNKVVPNCVPFISGLAEQ